MNVYEYKPGQLPQIVSEVLVYYG